MKSWLVVACILVVHVLTLCAEPTGEELRLQRLQALAEIWGRIYLLHPSIVRSDLKLDWSKVLLDTVPQAEKAKTPEEFARVLNDFLLKPLKDPFASARIVRPENTKDHSASLTSRMLSKSVGYIDVSHPEIYKREKFLQEFYDRFQKLPSATVVIIDLRWQEPKVEYPDETFLRFFVDRPTFTGSFLSRVHEGWNESGEWGAYTQKWEITNGYSIDAIQNADRYFVAQHRGVDFKAMKPITTPVIFLVNNTSGQAFVEYLDLLQAQRNAGVIWEQTGNLLDWSEIAYPENLQVTLNVTQFISVSGGLGLTPDFQTDRKIEISELPEIALKVVNSRKAARNSHRSDSDLTMYYPVEPPPKNGAFFTREEKLLGLFKIWIVIKNFFPHLEFADLNWNSVLHDWIPKVEATKDPKAYYEVLKVLSAKLNDSHIRVSYRDPKEGPTEWGCVPMLFGKVEGKVILTKVKPEALQSLAIRTGDEVLEINGMRIKEFESKRRETTSVSSPQSLDYRIYESLYWDQKDTPLKLKIRKSNNEIVELALKYDLAENVWEEDLSNTQHSKLLNQHIGYIDATTIPSLQDFDKALEAFANTDGLVLDIRGYPDFNAQATLSRLSDQDVQSTLFEVPVLKANAQPENSWSVSHYTIKPVEKPKYRKPIVALINERAISAAEDYCIYLKNAKRVTFVGSRTTGTNGNVTGISLPGGGYMSFTGMRVKFGDGSRFQNIGIIPDVEVAPTVQGIIQGKDEVLEKGIETLEGLIAKK